MVKVFNEIREAPCRPNVVVSCDTGSVDIAHRIRRSRFARNWQLNERIFVDETMCIVNNLIEESQNDKKSTGKQA